MLNFPIILLQKFLRFKSWKIFQRNILLQIEKGGREIERERKREREREREKERDESFVLSNLDKTFEYENNFYARFFNC